MRLWTGGYTAEMDGASSGIGLLDAGEPGMPGADGGLSFAGTAALRGGSPSWLARHPRLDLVYAALEGSGAVQAFERTGEEQLTALGEPVPAGDLVCHVAVAPDGGSLLAACWGDGRVVQMRLDAAGRPSSPRNAPAAADPYSAAGIGAPASEDEARASRAHQSVYLPGGIVATTDMGFDLVRFWEARGERLRAAGQVRLPRGSGPRHCVRHPSGHLCVVTELSCEVFVLGRDAAGAWQIVGSTGLSSLARPGSDHAAELCMSADGAFLYAGLRGSDTIATLRVGDGGTAVEPMALTESRVRVPRHHLVLGDTMLVAGQGSSEVVSLALDPATGIPGRERGRTAVPSPSCLLPAR